MKVLVVGYNGQVGSEIPTALTRTFSRTASCEIDITVVTRSQLDLTHSASISTYLNKLEPHFIINASAYTAVDRAESEIDLAYRINETAVRELCTYCKHNASKMIHISTDYVFDGLANKPYRECDAVGPTGVYTSKLAGENAIREILRHHNSSHFMGVRVKWT